MPEYIDVRGVYPVYFRGFQFCRLPMDARGWTKEQAYEWAVLNNVIK